LANSRIKRWDGEYEIRSWTAASRDTPRQHARFTDAWFARQTVEELLRDPFNEYELRTLVETLFGVVAPTRAQLVDRLARALVDGELLLIPRQQASGWMVHTQPSEAESDSTESPPPSTAEELTWISARLLDEDGEPIANVRYRVRTPDGSLRKGTTDDNGELRLDDVLEGTCDLTYVQLDEQPLEL
jgi:hypothetical protein